MEKRDLIKEAKDFTDKAKRLKSEFEKLQYSERLKFMDDNFRGFSSVYEGIERIEEPILSIWPVSEEQIKLYNEWKIQLFEKMEPYLSLDFSFEKLKKGFNDHILNIKKENPHPEKAINDYTQDQIRQYKEKVQSRDIQLQWKEFGGAWDITKKVIVNLGPFLKARSYYNYISFLENQSDNLTGTKEPIIEKMYLELIFKSFKEWFPDETKETWIQRFVYPCEAAINPIKIEPTVKTENNRLILIAVLGAIQDSDKTNFEYSKFVLERFGIKAFKKAKNEHKHKPKYIESYKKCETIMKK